MICPPSSPVPLFQSVKSSFCYLKTCHPVKATAWSTPWFVRFQTIKGQKKEPQTQRIARRAPKNFLKNSEFNSRALPSKTRVLRQIAPEYSLKSSANSLSQKFSGVPFPVPETKLFVARTSRIESANSSRVVVACLGEGRLGLPDQVWELRFLPSFLSFPRENRSSEKVWENESQTSFHQTSTTGLNCFYSQFRDFPDFFRDFQRCTLHMGKLGSICHFPRALCASIWGHCSQVLVFTSIWGAQKGVWE